MSWVRIDDRWWSEPAVLGLSCEARDLFVRLLAYCGMHDTDGVLTRAAVVAASAGQPPEDRRVQLLTELVQAEFLAATRTGWQVARPFDYLRPRSEVEAERAQHAEAGRRGGATRGKTGVRGPDGKYQRLPDAAPDARLVDRVEPELSVPDAAPEGKHKAHQTPHHTLATRASKRAPHAEPDASPDGEHHRPPHAEPDARVATSVESVATPPHAEPDARLGERLGHTTHTRPDPSRPVSGSSTVPSAVPGREAARTHQLDVGRTLTARQHEAWSDYGSEWDAVRAAWIGRGLRLPPTGRQDEAGTQRAILHEVLRDRPTDLVTWVAEAPGKTSHDVVAYVLAKWHEIKADASGSDRPDGTQEESF